MRLIDADALLNSGYPTIYHTEFGDEVINTEDIKNAPTVEYTFEEAFQKTVCENRLYCPARPQGKWELIDNSGRLHRYSCSICGHQISCIPSCLQDYKGCYCGADMRGNQE